MDKKRLPLIQIKVSAKQHAYESQREINDYAANLLGYKNYDDMKEYSRIHGED